MFCKDSETSDVRSGGRGRGRQLNTMLQPAECEALFTQYAKPVSGCPLEDKHRRVCMRINPCACTCASMPFCPSIHSRWHFCKGGRACARLLTHRRLHVHPWTCAHHAHTHTHARAHMHTQTNARTHTSANIHIPTHARMLCRTRLPRTAPRSPCSNTRLSWRPWCTRPPSSGAQTYLTCRRHCASECAGARTAGCVQRGQGSQCLGAAPVGRVPVCGRIGWSAWVERACRALVRSTFAGRLCATLLRSW